MAITAGSDVDMQSEAYLHHLADLVEAGVVPEELIDDLLSALEAVP